VKLRIRKQGTGDELDLLIKCASWGQYQSLLYREWEVLNEQMVERLSEGRIGYIHIAGMSQSELRKFERELFSEVLDKDALIVDVRFNGGGNIHEQLFDLLDRNHFSWSVPREAAWRIQPARSFNKPKAVLMNARSASDAEIFPSGWRTLGFGPVIGVATPGAVIGTSGFTLVDGSSVRLPYVGWYDLDGRNLETIGTQPDVEVVLDPNTLHRGEDAQLETAVRLLLEELANQPPAQPLPQPYPPAL
jgi:tricorn protease